MRVVCYQVEREGVLVERFLRQQGLSHRLLVDLKKDENGLTVDGRPVRTIDRLHAGNVVRVRVTETDRSDIVPQHGLPLPIVYEDEDLFVIDKNFSFCWCFQQIQAAQKGAFSRTGWANDCNHFALLNILSNALQNF